MMRHIIALTILAFLSILLGFFVLNPDSHTYQTNILMDIEAQYDNIPNSKYETELYKDKPFISWLVQNQGWIFIICVLLSILNVMRGYYKKGKFYHFIQKLYKEQQQ